MGKKQRMPLAHPREATIANYNATASNYITDPFECPEILDHILQVLQEANPLNRPRALVVGCGPADDAATLAGMGFDVTGIDNAPEMIAEAISRNPAISVQEMDMKDIGQGFQEDEFDLIFSHYSLFHELKKNLPDTIAGFAKVLKQGGFVYLTTQESMNGVPQETTSQRSDDNEAVYINAETDESLTKLFANSGIEFFFIVRREPRPEEHQFFKLTMGGRKLGG